MTLEQQVCSLESAKRLKELGVKQESLFYHYKEDDRHPWVISYLWDNGGHDEQYSAFTVAELGEMLPSSIIYSPKTGYVKAETEAEARAKMLIYLLSNKLISTE